MTMRYGLNDAEKMKIVGCTLTLWAPFIDDVNLSIYDIREK